MWQGSVGVESMNGEFFIISNFISISTLFAYCLFLFFLSFDVEKDFCIMKVRCIGQFFLLRIGFSEYFSDIFDE